MQQDLSGKLSPVTCFSGSPGEIPHQTVYQECTQLVEKKCHFPTDSGRHLEPWGNAYREECFHSMP